MHFVYSEEMQSCLTHTRAEGPSTPPPCPRGKRSEWGKIFLWFYSQWHHLQGNQMRQQLEKTCLLVSLPYRMLDRVKILNLLRLFLQLWICYIAWDSNISEVPMQIAFFCIKQEIRNRTVFQGSVSETPEYWMPIRSLLIIIIILFHNKHAK